MLVGVYMRTYACLCGCVITSRGLQVTLHNYKLIAVTNYVILIKSPCTVFSFRFVLIVHLLFNVAALLDSLWVIECIFSFNCATHWTDNKFLPVKHSPCKLVRKELEVVAAKGTLEQRWNFTWIAKSTSVGYST